MHGHYGLTLLNLTYQNNTNFTKITGIKLPSKSEIGLLPAALYAMRCGSRLTSQVLDFSYWKNAITNIQVQYRQQFKPSKLNFMVVAPKNFNDKYKMGIDHAGNFTLLLHPDINMHNVPEYVIESVKLKDGSQAILIRLGVHQDLALEGITPGVISNTNTQQHESISLAFVNVNQIQVLKLSSMQIRIIPNKTSWEHEGIRIFSSSAVSNFDIATTHLKANCYNPEHDNILVRALEEQWPLETIEKLLDLGANLRQPDKNGQYPHHHAARSNKRVDALDLFLKQDPALVNVVDHNNRTAFSIAIQKEAIACLNLLKSKGAYIGVISRSGHSEVEYAILSNNRETIKWAFANISSENHLSKNANHPTLFHVAIDNEYTRYFALLTLLSADISYPKEHLNQYNKDGYTPLHLAILKSTSLNVGMLLPYANVLQDTQHHSIMVNQSCIELALERSKNKPNDGESHLIFNMILNQFLEKASLQEFTAMWHKIKGTLSTNQATLLRDKCRAYGEKLAIISPLAIKPTTPPVILSQPTTMATTPTPTPTASSNPHDKKSKSAWRGSLFNNKG